MSHLLLIAAVLIWTPLLSIRIFRYAFAGLWPRLGRAASVLCLVSFAVFAMVLWLTRDRWIAMRLSTFPFALPLGLFFLNFGVVFGVWAARTLGFSPSKLVTRGPFAIVRHPLYFSEWFILLGALLITASPVVLFLLIAALLVDPAVTVLEEKELVARLGSDYVAYRRKVPRLLPTFKK